MRIVNKGRTFSYKCFLNFEEKYGKISDCLTFNDFKFSHFIARTSATLTVCVTMKKYKMVSVFTWPDVNTWKVRRTRDKRSRSWSADLRACLGT